MQDYTTAIFINASAAKVWQAITNPSTLHSAIGGDIHTNWHKGDTLRIQYVWEDEGFAEEGFITESIPDKLLKVSYLPVLADLEDRPENYQRVELHLEKANEGTQVRLVLENIQGEFMQQRVPEIWGEILYKLKEASEN